MKITRTWRCRDECSPFETLGFPAMCPHCGSSEVYPWHEPLRHFEVYDNLSADADGN